eukprot:jgi/Botrbrau1/20729/Bobra.0058s0057.1
MYSKFGDHPDSPNPTEDVSRNLTAIPKSGIQSANSHMSEFWGLVEQRQARQCVAQPQTCADPSVLGNRTALTMKQLRESPRYIPRNGALFGVELNGTRKCLDSQNSSQVLGSLGLLIWNGTITYQQQIQAPLVPFSVLHRPAIILKVALAATYQIDFLNGTMPTGALNECPLVALPLHNETGFSMVEVEGVFGKLFVWFGYLVGASNGQDPCMVELLRGIIEFGRVLRPSGVFISITFAQPHFRRPLLLADPTWDWGWYHTFFGPPGGFQYSLYALRRGTRTAQDTPEPFRSTPPAGPTPMAATEGPMHSHMDSEDYLLAIDI